MSPSQVRQPMSIAQCAATGSDGDGDERHVVRRDPRRAQEPDQHRGRWTRDPLGPEVVALLLRLPIDVADGGEHAPSFSSRVALERVNVPIWCAIWRAHALGRPPRRGRRRSPLSASSLSSSSPARRCSPTCKQWRRCAWRSAARHQTPFADSVTITVTSSTAADLDLHDESFHAHADQRQPASWSTSRSPSRPAIPPTSSCTLLVRRDSGRCDSSRREPKRRRCICCRVAPSAGRHVLADASTRLDSTDFRTAAPPTDRASVPRPASHNFRRARSTDAAAHRLNNHGTRSVSAIRAPACSMIVRKASASFTPFRDYRRHSLCNSCATCRDRVHF